MSINNRGVPPSEQAGEALRRKAEAEAKAREEKEILQGAMRRTFSTDDGKIVLKWIYDQCGANQSILGAMGGAIDEKATLYQAMRLNLWISIRKLLSFNILKEVEYEADQIS